MATYGRHGVIDGQTIVLRALFIDDVGNFIDPGVLPDVYIYDSNIDTDTIDSEVDGNTFTSALAGPLVPVRIDTGFYELTYVVPANASEGPWHDVWVSAINSEPSTAVLAFTVIRGAVISTQRLNNNELIVIELSASIADYNGLTLGSDIQLSFATLLRPYYASPDLLRLEAGPWLDFIPDLTLAIAIHWSSKEADFIAVGPKCDARRLAFARSKFVIFDAMLRAFYLPGSFALQPGGVLGTTKTLGNLTITNGNGAFIARTSSGIDVETLKEVKRNRDEWFRVLNAGGCITPGQSFGVQGAIKGKFDSDRRLAGRQWAEPDSIYYDQAGVNDKKRMGSSLRGKFYWKPTQSGSGEGLY